MKAPSDSVLTPSEAPEAEQAAPAQTPAAVQAAPAQTPTTDQVTPQPAPATEQAPPAAAPAVPAGAAPAQAAPAPAVAQAEVAAEADTIPDPDGGWPRLIEAASGARIVMFQPQVLSWKNQRHMVAMSAVSYTPKGAQKAALGTVRLESPTSTSIEERMVNFIKVEVTSMSFQSLEKAQTQEVLEEIRKSLPKENLLVALDRILAMVDTTQIGVRGVTVNTVPPPIFYSKKPAILVQFDGEPIMSQIQSTSLKYVINTNWDVFQDGDTKLYYLRNETYWLQSLDLKKWEPVKKLPPSFEKLANDDNWNEVRANIPGKKISKGKMPVVFVSRTPSELILVDGSPKYDEVEDTNLSWVKNCESDVFRFDDKKKEHYVLLSGRWFRTASLEKGPWEFATPTLPADFSKIPRGHERARVLSSVPGTEEAAEAILLAQVPRTARVDAKALKAPDVKYDGEPKFKQIEGTSVSYAENTGYDVLKAGDLYYLCFQGVWFMSKAATGPWEVTTSIPPEIYAIPATSPAHHVTYVTVIDDDPNYPTYGYTAGYIGVTVAFGCAMWGTGWYYPPYAHYPGYGAPIYYPRPVAYGGGAVYNPWNGSYGHYQAAYGPYGGVARGASYNPNTGTYARGAMAWGPTGAQGYAQAYNPRTGTSASTRQGSNVYGSWGSTNVQRGDAWVQTQRVTDAQGNTRWKAQGSGGGSATGVRGPGGGGGFVGQKGDDIYAGRDGNVYRKSDGGWQQYQQGGGWSDVSRPSGGAGGAGQRPSQQPATGAERPSARPSQQPSGGQSPWSSLDREARARDQGSQRTRDYSNYQRSGGSSGSYSGSRGGGGGGRRGGGGGRRR